MDIGNNSSAFESACNITKSTAKSSSFKVLLSLEVVFGLTAFILNILLLLVIWRVRVFHNNLRLVLAHFSIILIWYSLGYTVKAISHLIMLANSDPCLLVIQIYQCMLHDIAMLIPLLTVVYAAMSIALERLYSTLHYEKYDTESEKKPYLGIILIIVLYIIPMATTTNRIIKGKSQPAGYFLPICETSLSSAPSSIRSTIIVNLTSMSLCLIIVLITWYINIKKLQNMLINQAMHSLTARFQIEQNVKVNRIIVPTVLTQLLCFIPNYIFLIFVVISVPLNMQTKILLLQGNAIWKLCYAMAHPIYCFTRHTRMRKGLNEILPVMKLFKEKIRKHGKNGEGDTAGQGPVAIDHAHEVHFQILSNMWAPRGNSIHPV